MAELPDLPIATAALIADTVHMSAEQFGAYVRILMAMWARGAELRDDEAELARIAGVTLKRFRAIRDVVMEPNVSDFRASPTITPTSRGAVRPAPRTARATRRSATRWR